MFPTNATLLPNAANVISLTYVDSSGATNSGSFSFRTTGAPVSNTAGNTSVNTNAHGFLVYPNLYLGLYQNDALTWAEMGYAEASPRRGQLQGRLRQRTGPPPTTVAILDQRPARPGLHLDQLHQLGLAGPRRRRRRLPAPGASYPKSELPGVSRHRPCGGTGQYYTGT